MSGLLFYGEIAKLPAQGQQIIEVVVPGRGRGRNRGCRRTGSRLWLAHLHLDAPLLAGVGRRVLVKEAHGGRLGEDAADHFVLHPESKVVLPKDAGDRVGLSQEGLDHRGRVLQEGQESRPAKA